MRSSARSVIALVALAAGVALAGTAWRHAQAQRLGEQVARSAQAGDITMLSSTTCAYCAQARAWFDTNAVRYDECFIERDPVCAASFAALQGRGTPLLIVRGQRQEGFSPRRIADALRDPARSG